MARERRDKPTITAPLPADRRARADHHRLAEDRAYLVDKLAVIYSRGWREDWDG
jgi:hypothetical protein